jgi:hypothetical protein
MFIHILYGCLGEGKRKKGERRGWQQISKSYLDPDRNLVSFLNLISNLITILLVFTFYTLMLIRLFFFGNPLFVLPAKFFMLFRVNIAS